MGVIPAEAVEAAHKSWREQAALDGSIFEYNLRAALEAAAPYIRAQALEDAAEELATQRDATNPDRSPEESWSVIDHRAGRFLGKTVGVRLLRTRAAAERGGE